MIEAFDPNRVRQFKLSTGESIIAYLNATLEDKDIVLIERPYKIISSIGEEGSIKYMLTEWLEMGDPDKVLALLGGSIVCMSAVRSDALSFYIESITMHSKDRNQPTSDFDLSTWDPSEQIQ